MHLLHTLAQPRRGRDGQGRAREWARSKLTTVGEACRAMLRVTLGNALERALERVTVDGWEVLRVKMALFLTWGMQDPGGNMKHRHRQCLGRDPCRR
jgi:hypothetical protein